MYIVIGCTVPNSPYFVVRDLFYKPNYLLYNYYFLFMYTLSTLVNDTLQSSFRMAEIVNSKLLESGICRVELMFAPLSQCSVIVKL